MQQALPRKKDKRKKDRSRSSPPIFGRCHASYCALTPQGSNPMRGKRRNLEKRAGLQEFAIYYIVEPFRRESLLKAKCSPPSLVKQRWTASISSALCSHFRQTNWGAMLTLCGEKFRKKLGPVVPIIKGEWIQNTK